MKAWYCEYKNHTRIHDYFNLMINQFPILVIRKLDNPHSSNDNLDAVYSIGVFGFTWNIKK
jgi:hypothetical protein